jgi:hypothetical protein
VLWHRPDAARRNYDARFDAIRYDTGAAAKAAFERWCEGCTGYPIVDAGMRQLLAEGWMHNRIRMVVASFLVKDLYLPWRWGARHFMRHLVDCDLASNQLNWQWVAGSGTYGRCAVLPRSSIRQRKRKNSIRTATTSASTCRNSAQCNGKPCTTWESATTVFRAATLAPWSTTPTSVKLPLLRRDQRLLIRHGTFVESAMS